MNPPLLERPELYEFVFDLLMKGDITSPRVGEVCDQKLIRTWVVYGYPESSLPGTSGSEEGTGKIEF